MAIQPKHSASVSSIVILRDWSVIISPFAFALVVFGLEYAYLDSTTLMVFFRSTYWFFGSSSIAVAFRSTGDANFLYFVIYVISMVPLYLLNTSIFVYAANKWAKMEVLANEARFMYKAALGFTVVIGALLFLFPDAYIAHRQRPFPPNIWGIISYSFFYGTLCFFTMPAWAIGFYHLNQRFYFLKRK